MKPHVIPATIERIADAWAANSATPEQLEYAARELPRILEEMPHDAMTEGEYQEWSQTASGINLARLRYQARERLKSEGIEPTGP